METATKTGTEAAGRAAPMGVWAVRKDMGHVLNLDRAGLAALAAGVARAMDDGEEDPLRMLALSRKAAELFSRIERAARERCPLGLAGGEALRAYGCEITERETGVRYDYTVCGDAEWESLAARARDAAGRKKEREAFLRTVPGRRIGPGGACANPVFGADGAEILPPLRSGSIGLAVTVK